MSSDRIKKLKDIESEIDKLCLKKRLHTEAEHLKRIKCVKTLRLYTKVCLKGGTFIRIDTRVINDYKNNEQFQVKNLIKRLCVVFNSDLEDTLDFITTSQGEDKKESPLQTVEVFEWNKNNEEHDSFELRHTSTPLNIKLLLEFENQRDMYKLSPCLREITGKWTETKPNVITSIWKYIHKLNIIKTGEIEVVSDEKLKKLSGKDRFLFTDLPEIIVGHLSPIDFLVIDLPVSHEPYKKIFDIPVEIDDLYHPPRMHSKEVYAYEKKVEMLLEFKKRLEEKKEVLFKFEKNPIEFINRWICSESTDYYTKTSFLLDKNIQVLLQDLVKKLT